MNKNIFLITIILGLMLIPLIQAVPQCIQNIQCNVSGTVSNGSIISPDYKNNPDTEMCHINPIDTSIGTNSVVNIEIIRGGMGYTNNTEDLLIDKINKLKDTQYSACGNDDELINSLRLIEEILEMLKDD